MIISTLTNFITPKLKKKKMILLIFNIFFYKILTFKMLHQMKQIIFIHKNYIFLFSIDEHKIVIFNKNI